MEVLLVNQYRYPIKKNDWNLPGGGIDKGESGEVAIAREVREEVGVSISNPQKLGAFYPLSSFNTELVTLFSAQVEKPEAFTSSLSEEEFTSIKFIPIKDALAMIDSGEIADACTANALQLFARKYA